MSEHGAKAGVRMVGRGSALPAAQTAIEAFKATGGAKVFDVPVGVTCMEGKVGDGGPEVAAQASDRLGLGGAIAAYDLAIALEHGSEALGLPNLVKVTEDGFAPPPLFLAGEIFIRKTDGMVEVAQLMEKTALLGGAKVDGVEGCTQAAAPVMDDQFQPMLATDAQRFEFAQESQPLRFILLGGQTPGQDFRPPRLRPDAQSNEDRSLDALFVGAAAPLAIEMVAAGRHQLRHPDGVHLQD